MTGATDWITRVDGLLSRLSCESLIEPVNVERLREQLLAAAAAIGESDDSGARCLADRVRQASPAVSPKNVDTIVKEVLSGWEALREGAPPPVVQAPDEDLAVLADDPEMLGVFMGEAIDHLGTIESLLLQVESAPGDVKLLNDVFRPFHTIKGNAGALGVTSVQGVAHKVENLLDLARSGKHAMGSDECDVVLKAVDLLTLMIQELPARIAGEPFTDVKAQCRGLIGAVDALIAGGGRAAATESQAPVVAALSEADGGSAPQRRRDESQSAVKVDTRKLDNLVDMVGELVIAQSILAEHPVLLGSRDERLSRQLAQLKRITSELQRNAMAMRMMPIRPTFQKMSRLVRDLGKKSGKSIELTLHGEDTELDRKVVEEINDPLMHMVRNSVDHGIEPADVRKAAGKPALAALRLRAFHQAGNIVIEISDDGAGLDTEKIYRKAVAKGLVPEGAPMTPEDINLLIFQPGFSTADTVTEISGRGVGMDVVRRNIEALRGRIEIQTVRGQGTTFAIRLPLTLAIVDGILVGVGDERFVIPAVAVNESLRPAPGQVHSVQGRPCMIQVREQLIPLMHLAEAFGVTGARQELGDSTVVVIEDNDRLIALVVDELLGKQEVVIKSLGDVFGHVRGVAGGAILADGRIGLILDVSGLAALMGKSTLKPAA